MNDLYQKKIHVNAAIHQEELRMTRLLKTIVWSSQAQESRVLLDETVEKFRNAKQENSKKLSAWGMAEEQKKQNVDSLLAEEKVTEKQFKVINSLIIIHLILYNHNNLNLRLISKSCLVSVLLIQISFSKSTKNVQRLVKHLKL